MRTVNSCVLWTLVNGHPHQHPAGAAAHAIAEPRVAVPLSQQRVAPELFHGVIAQVPFVDVVTTMLDETIPLTTGEFEAGRQRNGLIQHRGYHVDERHLGYHAVEQLWTLVNGFEEWGNPQDETYYHYMKSYSPYDGVKAQAYPHMLVTKSISVQSSSRLSSVFSSRSFATHFAGSQYCTWESWLHDSQVQYWEPAKWVAKLRELKTDDNLLLLCTDSSATPS
jgi:oligopeptidase B